MTRNKVGELENCIIRIRAQYPALRPSERKVADYILEHPERVVHLSVTELSNLTGISDAAIIKFCQRLGYRGYQELKIYLAQELKRNPLPEIYGEVEAGDDLFTVKEKLFQANARALTDTKEVLNEDHLDQAIMALSSAGKVHFLGVGASGFVALDAQLKFSRIGLPAMAFPDFHNQISLASLLVPGDVAVAISHSGETRDVEYAVRVAKEAGATTIAITNYPGSAIAQAVEIPLFTAATETAFRSGAIASRIAQLSVVDVLFIGVIQKREAAARQCLAKTRAALRHKMVQTGG